MPLIRPFAGLRRTPENVDKVIAPPYDVLNSQEARILVKNRPWSFLHISKPEIDLPIDTDPYSEAVYQKGASNLHNMLHKGVIEQDEQVAYYLYALTMDNHKQIGLVAVASVDAYNKNIIRKHELTRPDKENDRIKQIDTLNAQTGPVFLTYKHDNIIDDLVNKITKNSPTVQVTAEGGVIHQLWVVIDSAQIELISTRFDQFDCLYVADGHHRSAAAAKVAEKRLNNNPTHTGEEAYNYFLTVIFPDNQVQIFDYNRVVKDLNNLSATEFLQKISNYFAVKTSNYAFKPQQAGEIGMYLDGQWYQLKVHADKIPSDDPVASLDVSLLTNCLLDPVLDIKDLRRDKRIDFVGGIRGLRELEKRVDSGEMAVAFSLYPTSMQALMNVADAEKLMPPKSTWFEPKLADGLVSHLL